MNSVGDSNKKWGVLLAIGIGTFMTALDGSVVNIILPVVGKSFNETIASVEWVVTIYLLVLSGLLLSFGRLGDIRGHKRIYITGFVVFVMSSLTCGFAPSLPVLIISRSLQAFGAAMIAANSPAILTKSFPAQQRGQALGLQATMTYLGLTVGPSLGGWLASLLGWRVVFYINFPVGLLAIWLSLRFIPRDSNYKQAEKFDFMGAATFVIGLGSLLLALNQANQWGWVSLYTLGLLAFAILLLVLFVYIERHVPSPMLDLSLFKRSAFSLSAMSAIFNYISLFSSIFLMPFFLIEGRGYTSAEAGLILTAQPLVMAIVAPISGTLSDRIGSRLPTILGMAILSAGLFLLSRLDGQSAVSTMMLSLAVVGLGTGIFISPNNSALMGSAPKSRQGIAAGILATARNFGMVLGVGIAGAVFTTVLVQAGNPVTPPAGSNQSDVIYRALELSFMIAALIALLGVFTSLGRPSSSGQVIEEK